MSAPALSVVIPTHRRPAILSACIEHLERQTAADAIEVIVVSDGSTVRAVQPEMWDGASGAVLFRTVDDAM